MVGRKVGGGRGGAGGGTRWDTATIGNSIEFQKKVPRTQKTHCRHRRENKPPHEEGVCPPELITALPTVVEK